MLKVLTAVKAQRITKRLFEMAEKIASVGVGIGIKRPPEDEADTEVKIHSKKKKKKQPVTLGKSEGCKRKIAMLVAYNGTGYYGVQVNPGFPTIESEIFPTLVKVGSIPQDHADTPSKMWFQRGSRTDKGVSAIGQTFSMKIVLVPDLVNKLNEILPPQIRIMGYVRTTNGFDSKNFCCSRTYMYMMPTYAFAPIEKFITPEYRTSPEILDRVRHILKMYVGTHNFHNFTSQVKFEQAKAARYIIKFECSEPYVRDGIEFVTLHVKGQSFMLHHIRKMIGLTIAIVRGFCGESIISRCWGPEKVDVPKAPGLGLVLEALHFDGYNKKYGQDGIHEPIDWSSCKEAMEKFKEEQVISEIISQEKKDRVMFTWLQTLQFHSFGEPRMDRDRWGNTAKLLREKPESPQKNQAEAAADTNDSTQIDLQSLDGDIEIASSTNALASGNNSTEVSTAAISTSVEDSAPIQIEGEEDSTQNDSLSIGTSGAGQIELKSSSKPELQGSIGETERNYT